MTPTDSYSGGNICTTIVIRILEHHTQIPRPISMILAYPALDFNYTSWMTPANLRVLRIEQSEAYIPGILQGKDHLRHKAPLSVVDDVDRRRGGGSARQRQRTWGQAVRSKLPSIVSSPTDEKVPFDMRSPLATNWQKSLPRVMSAKLAGWMAPEDDTVDEPEGAAFDGSDSEEEHTVRTEDQRREQDKSLKDRVKTPKTERRMDFPMVTPLPPPDVDTDEPAAAEIQAPEKRRKAPIGTRLTMTSRVGYFQDRVISPSMVRTPERPARLLISSDACHGHPLCWTPEESRFRHGLLYLASPSTVTTSCSFPSCLPDMWRARPVCG